MGFAGLRRDSAAPSVQPTAACAAGFALSIGMAPASPRLCFSKAAHGGAATASPSLPVQTDVDFEPIKPTAIYFMNCILGVFDEK